jgi:hypothetical protein
MSELKTQPTVQSVDRFLAAIDDETKRADSQAVCRLMAELTGEPPTMWGPSIVGFGRYHYTYESGREGDWFRVGFSPRKQTLTLYLTYGFDAHQPLMAKLGKYKTGKACLYVKRLNDVDLDVLTELIKASLRETEGRN